MIHKFFELPPFAYITVIVQAQLIITGAMSMLIAFLLIKRTRRQRWEETQRVTFAEQLVEEMLNALGGEAGPPMLARPKSAAGREVMKRVFLEHLRSVSGFEREMLSKRYEDLGFVTDDTFRLHSRLWWRRLSAASDLATLDSGRFALDFHRLSFDRHELVSAFGHYALSGLDHEVNQVFAVARFPVSVRARRNLMIEILRNWARVRGTAAITRQIEGETDPRLLDALVSAAAGAADVEASEAFGDLLSRPNQFPPAALDGMLSCLRRVGDPKFTTVVTGYAGHANEVVRVRALEYLLAVGDFAVLDDPRVRIDRSVGVRRLIERWRIEQEAA